MWTTFDLRSFDRRLSVTHEIQGPEIELQKMNWRSGWNGPTLGLWTAFEVVNPNDHALEIVSFQFVFKDYFGNKWADSPTSLERFYFGHIGQGQVLLPHDRRPVGARVQLNPNWVPRPLLWKEMHIKIVVRPVKPESLSRYWRSSNLEIFDAGYRDDDAYELTGIVEDFVPFVEKYRADGGKGFRVYTIVSTYNADGSLVGVFYVPVPVGSNGNFKMVSDGSATVDFAQIDSYKIWFAELRPP